MSYLICPRCVFIVCRIWMIEFVKLRSCHVFFFSRQVISEESKQCDLPMANRAVRAQAGQELIRNLRRG